MQHEWCAQFTMEQNSDYEEEENIIWNGSQGFNISNGINYSHNYTINKQLFIILKDQNPVKFSKLTQVSIKCHDKLFRSNYYDQ